ncbi:MAG: hypothetical protein K0U64_09570 [Actinomycetia bacterium]|nr:hypothetical protein [Actinomycetes bacterium]
MTAQDKVALRQQLKADRQTLVVPQFASAAIGWLTSYVDREGDPSVLAAFQPTPTEPDITGFLRCLVRIAPSTTVLIPRPVGGEALEWVVAAKGQLEERPVGIPRPQGQTAGLSAAPFRSVGSIVLVPALAIDPSTGLRLGYGGGYYDRLLSELRAGRITADADSGPDPLIIGVCFERECRAVPAQEHDEPVTHIMTEAGVKPVRAPR